jgi:hypothetical protein
MKVKILLCLNFVTFMTNIFIALLSPGYKHTICSIPIILYIRDYIKAQAILRKTAINVKSDTVVFVNIEVSFATILRWSHK